MPDIVTLSDVFISYSRKNIKFARKLNDALEAEGMTVWADWEDIPKGSEWREEIRAGIRGATAFLFIISPDSAASIECGREIDIADKENKRMVPVVYLELEDGGSSKIHPVISEHNWIFARDNDDWQSAIREIVTTIRTDLEHVRAHTRLAVRAAEWDGQRRDPSYLLAGSDLKQAELWLASSIEKKPAASDLHKAYIYASREAATLRQRRVLAGVSVALVVSLALLVLAIFLGIEANNNANIAATNAVSAENNAATALWERDRANNNADVAATNESIAVEQAGVAQSRALAALAEIELRGGQPERAAILALTALENFPYTSQAERMLRKSVTDYPVRQVLNGFVEVSPGGSYYTETGLFGGITLYSADTHNIVWQDDAAYDPQWSRDDRYALVNLLAQDFFELPEGMDGNLAVIDMTIGDIAFTIPGYTSTSSWGYTWLDNNYLLTYSTETETYTLWESETWEPVRTMTYLPTADSNIGLLALSGDGRYALLVQYHTDGNSILVHDLETDTQTTLLEDALIADYVQAIPGSEGMLLLAPIDEADTGEIVYDVIDIASQSILMTYAEQPKLSPVSGYMIGTDSTADSAVLLIQDVRTGETITRLQDIPLPQPLKSGDASTAQLFVDWSPDERYLIVTALDPATSLTAQSVFYTEDWSYLQTYQFDTGFGRLAWLADNRQFVTIRGTDTLAAWTVESDHPLKQWTLPFTITQITNILNHDMLLVQQPVGTTPVFLVQDLPELLYMWPTDDFRLDKLQPIPGTDTLLVTTTLNDNTGLQAHYDGTLPSENALFVVDQASGEIQQTIVTNDLTPLPEPVGDYASPHLIASAAYSPDGSRLAIGTTGTRPAHFYPDGYGLDLLEWSDGKLFIQDADSGDTLLEIPHPGAVYALAWSPDGSQIATYTRYSAADIEFVVTVFDAATGESLFELTTGEVADPINYPFTWTQDGSAIVTSTVFGKIIVWDAADGSQLQTLQGHSQRVNALVSAPEWNRLVSGGNDNLVLVWDTGSWSILATFSGHSDAVTAAAWSPDGRLIATGAMDNTVKIWESATGSEIATLSGHTAMITDIRWLDADTILTASKDGTIRTWLWRTLDDEMAHAYDCCITRQLTERELNEFGLTAEQQIQN